MKYANVSVLMSVYYRELPNNLSESLESMVNQSLIPKQFVIVRDGQLTEELDQVLNCFSKKYSEVIDVKIVNLRKRLNLGLALNEGLAECDYSLVARMDSDDHALPYRIEKQINFLKNNKKVKVLSGAISEFSIEWSSPVSYRKVPVSPEKIFAFSRRRNPLNHMTVMFDRDFILKKMNGYNDIPGYEDYELWLRVLRRDVNALSNLPEVVVAARVTSLQSRRGGWNYVKKNAYARNVFFREGLISFNDFIITLIGGTFIGLFPNKIRDFLYKRILRK